MREIMKLDEVIKTMEICSLPLGASRKGCPELIEINGCTTCCSRLHDGRMILMNKDVIRDAIYQLRQYRKFKKEEPKSRVVSCIDRPAVPCCEFCGKLLLDVYKYCPECGRKLIYKGTEPELYEEMEKKETGWN